MDAPDQDLQQTRIMVCESDAYLAGLLNMLLRREGFSLTTLTQPTQTPSYLESATPPGLVFLDGDWVYNDQIDVIAAIRACTAWRYVPVILLLKYYRADAISRAMEAGATDYIIQPFDPVELMDQITRHRVTVQ
jgi:DNA-binding response OmpR family regulator